MEVPLFSVGVTRLFGAESDSDVNVDETVKSEEGDVATDDVAGEGEGEEAVAPDAAAESTDPAQDEEDAVIEDLKKKIASLTSDINSAKGELSDIREDVKLYSQNGYARLAADLQNFKKRRTETSKRMENEEVAKVLRGFMGTFGKFEKVREKWATEMESDEAIKSLINSYSALETSFLNEFTGLGVREFHAVQGEEMNASRLKKVGEELSEDTAKGCVIKEVKRGFELKGEVIEKSECIISMGGAEKKEEEEKEKGDNENEEEKEEEKEEMEGGNEGTKSSNEGTEEVEEDA